MIVIPGPYYRPIEFESPGVGPPSETVFKQCGIFIIRKVWNKPSLLVLSPGYASELSVEVVKNTEGWVVTILTILKAMSHWWSLGWNLVKTTGLHINDCCCCCCYCYYYFTITVTSITKDNFWIVIYSLQCLSISLILTAVLWTWIIIFHLWVEKLRLS